jgi:hypothetical protein
MSGGWSGAYKKVPEDLFPSEALGADVKATDNGRAAQSCRGYSLLVQGGACPGSHYQGPLHIHDKLRGCGIDFVHLTYTPWWAAAVRGMVLSARGGRRLLGVAGFSKG